MVCLASGLDLLLNEWRRRSGLPRPSPSRRDRARAAAIDAQMRMQFGDTVTQQIWAPAQADLEPISKLLSLPISDIAEMAEAGGLRLMVAIESELAFECVMAPWHTAGDLVHRVADRFQHTSACYRSSDFLQMQRPAGGQEPHRG